MGKVFKPGRDCATGRGACTAWPYSGLILLVLRSCVSYSLGKVILIATRDIQGQLSKNLEATCRGSSSPLGA